MKEKNVVVLQKKQVMTEQELLKAIRCGETSTIQFKEQFTTTRQVVEEMVAFSNSKGGRIIFGIADKSGEIIGLAYEEVRNRFWHRKGNARK